MNTCHYTALTDQGEAWHSINCILNMQFLLDADITLRIVMAKGFINDFMNKKGLLSVKSIGY